MENFKPEYQEPTLEPTQEKQKSAEAMRSIYRGIWAEHLDDGQELPIGGSLFSKELTTKLELDFATFDEHLSGVTEENFKKLYEQNKDSVIAWLEKVGSDVEPYTYFMCSLVQNKIHQLLEVDLHVPTNSLERQKKYWDEKSPKLSELKGKSECGERAAFGQYLLQKAGVESAYVSGITMQDVKDSDEFPENHSFIALKHPTKSESTLIFDIARPRSQQNVPRVLETDVPFTYDQLQNKEDLLIGATEVLQGGKLWFGIGEPVAGHHETIEKPERPE